MIAGLTPSPDEEDENLSKNPGPSYSGHIVEECVIPKIDIPFCTEDSQSMFEKSFTETISTTCYQTCRCSSHCNNNIVQDLSSSNSTLRSMSCTDDDVYDDDGDDEEEAQGSVNESSPSSVVYLTDFNFNNSPDRSSGFKKRHQSPLKTLSDKKTSYSCSSSLPSSKNSSTEIVNSFNPVLSFVPKNSLEISSSKSDDETLKERRQFSMKREMSLDLVPQINSIEVDTQVINPSTDNNITNNTCTVIESNLTLADGVERLNIVEDNTTKDSEIFCCDFFKKSETSKHSYNHYLDLVTPSDMPCRKDDSGPSLPSASLATCIDNAELLKVVKSSSDSKITNKKSSKCKTKSNVANCIPL